MSKCGKCCYGVMTMPNKMFCSVQNCFCEEVFDCEDFDPIIKQQTNADRIRNMTDEELAKFIQEDVFAEPWCPDDVPYVLGSGCQLIDKDCGKCALKWLKKEVEE